MQQAHRFCADCGCKNSSADSGRVGAPPSLALLRGRERLRELGVPEGEISRDHQVEWDRWTMFVKSIGAAIEDEPAPATVVAFLVQRAEGPRARKQIHVATCQNFRTPEGATGRTPCACKRHCTIGSLQCVADKLKGAFKAIGRGAKWGGVAGNPVDSLLVKRYLKAVAMEQTSAMAGQRSRPTLSAERFGAMMAQVWTAYAGALATGDALEVFLVLQDAHFFCMDFLLLERGAELASMTTNQAVEVAMAGETRAWQIHFSSGKCARKPADIKGSIMLLEAPARGASSCPIALWDKRVAQAVDMGLDIRNGCLFRAVRKRAVAGKPAGVSSLHVTAGAMRARFAAYLTKAGLPKAGLHAMRRGGLTTHRVNGMSRQMRQHLGGWSSTTMMPVYDDGDEGDI